MKARDFSRADVFVKNLFCWKNLLRRLFQNSLLQLFLALNAVARPRHRFQPLAVDLFPARNAFAECAFADPSQRTLHHLQELAVIIALGKKKFFGVRTGCAVGNILRRIFIHGSAILLCAHHDPSQILLTRFQPLLEIIQFFLVHTVHNLEGSRLTAKPLTKTHMICVQIQMRQLGYRIRRFLKISNIVLIP
jgi:hypothetical protein